MIGGAVRRRIVGLHAGSLLAPLHLTVALRATPSPVAAAPTCALAFSLFDANATNGGSTAPGGTGVTLAYPGYTNGLTVDVDVKQGSTGCSDTAFNKTTWYVMFSRWAAGIIDGTNAAQVDAVGASLIETAGSFNYTNDFTGGFDLAAGGATTPTSGSTLTVYGDITQCDISQGTTAGFAPDYYVTHSSTSGAGAFYWLALGASNAGSKRRTDGGSWVQGGGGKGYCFNFVDPRRSDTIIYDTAIPSITALTVNGGSVTNSATPTLSLTATDNTALWLMAFSNSATCSYASTLGTEWSPWEAYAATKAWPITSGYGSVGAGEGPHTVCVRVMDRAGNLDSLTVTLGYDLTAPAVASFATALASPTNATSLPYTLAFNESVTGLVAADITNVGSATGCLPTVTGSGASYTIAFTGCGTSGTLVPRLAAGSVTDLAGNAGPLAATTGESLTLDRIPPTVSTFARDTSTDSGSSASDGITNAAAPAFLLTFSESITGLAAGDFALSGTAAGCSISAPTGSGSSYRVAVSGCGEGTLTLILGANTVADLATNPGPVATSAATGSFTIDRTPPAGCTLVIDAGAAYTRSGVSTLTIGCTTVSPATDRMRFSNNAAIYSTDEPYATTKSNWSLVTGNGASGGEGAKMVTLQVIDLAGNSATASDAIGYDPTPPTLVISDPAPGSEQASNLPLYPLVYDASDATSGPPTVSVRRERVAVAGPACPVAGWAWDGDALPTAPGLLAGPLQSGFCYRWTLVATDGAGNSTSLLSGRILTDLVAPVVSSLILGDGSGVTIATTLSTSVAATDPLSGLAAARWSVGNGGEWQVSCRNSGLVYAANRTASLTLGAGAGDYAVAVEVCDAAGNVRQVSDVVRLDSARRLPTLVLGARIVDCADESRLLATNTTGSIYWPTGRELCLVPTLVSATDGSDLVNGVARSGATGAGDAIELTLLSSNPCPAGSDCAGLVGRYPDELFGSPLPVSSSGPVLRLRLDAETTSAPYSLPAVSLTTALRVNVRWYAAGSLVATTTHTSLLSLHLHAYATGARPGP